MRTILSPVGLAFWLAASGCSSSSSVAPPLGELPPGDAGADTELPDAAAGDATDASASIPNSPAGKRLEWVLAALNGATVADADVADNFAPAFLAQVPAAQLEQVFVELAPKAPWILVGFEGPVASTQLVAVVTRGDGQYWRISLATDSAQAGKIAGLMLSPAADLDPALASPSAIDAALAGLGTSADWLLASVDAGACSELHAYGATSSLAIGSAFKLWVLATLADDVDKGTRAFADKLAIQDAWKSLPSGDLQNQPVGTELTLLQYAQKMISISDNTAADHLLFTVGRDAVEAMLTTTGHHDPALDQPFLGTRELFTLKLMLSPAEQQAYVAAPIAERRTLLAQYDTSLDPRTYTGPDWNAPIRIDELEWFATPMDLCNVMAALKTYGDKTATQPVYDVLSMNPGVADAAGAFTYVGYKGGSEPGVLDLTWLVERKSDKAWRCVTVGVNDTAKALDEDRVVYVAAAARALAAK